MMVSNGRTVLATLAVLTTLAYVPHAAPPADVISFAVPGRSNTTPWVAGAGDYVAVTWGAGSAGKTDVFVAVSRDGGRTFGPPTQVNAVTGEARLGGELPPRVSLSPGPRAGVPEIAVLWTARGKTTEVRTARSRDNGKTFAAPMTLQSAGALGDRGWPALALDQQGTAHAIWLDHRGLAAARAGGAAPAAHQPGVAHDGMAMAAKSGLYYAAAAVKGSPALERDLADGVCYCCKTALAVGPDGALYAAWRHVFAGSRRDVAFTASRDGGRTFAAPVRISEDGWAVEGCPDDGPAMAVDAAGTVHVVWPTVIGGASPQAALFYASTRDGRTFTPRTRIPTLGSPKPSHPQIALAAGGQIVVAWDELVKGTRVAAARQLTLTASQPVSFGPVVMLSGDGPGMYPVLAATRSGLLAVWTTGGEQSAVQARVITLP